MRLKSQTEADPIGDATKSWAFPVVSERAAR